MCLLVFAPAGVSRELLISNLDRINQMNSDGFGMAWVRGEKVRVQKGMWPQEQQLHQLQSTEHDCIYHWRAATHGTISAINCHPFSVHGAAVAHNGVLPIIPLGDESDTMALLNCARGKTHLDELLTEWLSAKNKFVAMWPEKTKIYGEEHGTWKDGLWLSNTYWQDFSWNQSAWANTVEDDLREAIAWAISNGITLREMVDLWREMSDETLRR